MRCAACGSENEAGRKFCGAQGRADEAESLLAEAREIFERLEAAPWLERAGRSALARVPAETT